MSYFQTASLANVDALFQTIENCLTSSGWTPFRLNTTLVAASTASTRALATRETIFKCNGTSQDPANFYLSVCRTCDINNVAAHKLVFTLFSGVKNLTGSGVAISSISRAASGLTQVSCSSPHNLIVGDRFIINGTDVSALNEMWGPTTNTSIAGDANPSLGCIVLATSSANNFSFQSNIAAAAGPGTTGSVVVVYNLGSSRVSTNSNGSNAGLGVSVADSTMSLYMYYDAYRFTGMVVQGGVYQPFYVGETNRDHIPNEYKDRAFLNASIPSGSMVTASLDRSCTNISAGQFIWLVHPSGSAATGSVERVRIITKPSPTTFTCNLSSSGGFPSGSFVGEDPVPACVIANLGYAAAGINMGSKTARFVFHLNGQYTDTLSQAFTPYVETGMTEADVDPDSAGYYIGRDIYCSRATAPSGVRGKLVGIVAFPFGAQNDLDIMRVGPSPVNDDYKIFVSRTIDGTWLHALGGGAS